MDIRIQLLRGAPSLPPLGFTTLSHAAASTLTSVGRPSQRAQFPQTPSAVLSQVDSATRDEAASSWHMRPTLVSGGEHGSPEEASARSLPPPHTLTAVDDRGPSDRPQGRTGGTAHVMRSMVVYSPTTARRIPVTMGAAGPQLQHAAEVSGSTGERTRHKRLSSTPMACTFCKRRKIACGGPLPSDEARRCG